MTKTFEVWHIEDQSGINSDRYYNGEIEAENMDKAIEIFKNEWIKPEFKNDISEDYQDEGLCYLDTGLEWFSNGNLLSDKEIEELEAKYEMGISELMENYDNNDEIEKLEIGFIDHIYELKDNDFDPDNDDDDNDMENEQ